VHYNPNVKDLTLDPPCISPIRVTVQDGTNVYQPAFTDNDSDGDDLIDTGDPSKGSLADNHTYNQTNYLTMSKDILIPHDTSHKTYDYRHDGRDIVFAQSWPAGSKITAEYYTMVNEIRVKAILRRVVPGFESFTPVIKEYSLRVRASTKL
jgi:hypothetical protein